MTFDGLASTPPFDGATLPDGGDRTLPASSSSSIDLTGMAQQEQRNLLVPSQEFRDLIFPTIVRHTIGTPAMIASADSRLVHRRKHGCYICGSKFTTKANRDREFHLAAMSAWLLTYHAIRAPSRSFRYETVRLRVRKVLHRKWRPPSSPQRY